MICKSPDEAFQAGYDDAADAPPLTQDQADLVAAILASARPAETRAA